MAASRLPTPVPMLAKTEVTAARSRCTRVSWQSRSMPAGGSAAAAARPMEK
jgi:hypothetical protein